MKPIFDDGDVIDNYNLIGVENSEIRTPASERNLNNLRYLSQEATDLLMQLNALANGYPFNIIYRAKINDPR
jgi:hypothetical protein